MKIIKTSKSVLILALTFIVTALLSVQASAHGYSFWKNNHGYTYSRTAPVVVAACTSLTPPAYVLPTYVCCKLPYVKNHHIHYAWRDKWVSGSCKMASHYARYDSGCTMGSLVYGTGAPIFGSCQITSRY